MSNQNDIDQTHTMTYHSWNDQTTTTASYFYHGGLSENKVVTLSSASSISFNHNPMTWNEEELQFEGSVTGVLLNG